MDISKASNLERFVFDLLGRDAARLKSLFDDQLRASGAFDLSADPALPEVSARFGFGSGKSTHADRLATIRDTWHRTGTVIDPHTADGVKVAREYSNSDLAMIVLETALPAKFAGTINEALGRDPDRPRQFIGIEDLPKRLKVLPADEHAVKNYISQIVLSAA